MFSSKILVDESTFLFLSICVHEFMHEFMMETPTAKKLILIADDNETDCELVERTLPSDEYVVRRALTHEEAVAILRSENVYLAFIDLYLDATNRMPYGVTIYEEFSQMLPIILMSGHDASLTDTALRELKEQRLAIMNKGVDFTNQRNVAARMHRHANMTYNREIEFEFSRNNSDFETLAKKLMPQEETTPSAPTSQLAEELALLVRKLFCDWDQSTSDHIRAKKLLLSAIPHAGTRTVALHVRPMSVTGYPQADVIVKIKHSLLPCLIPGQTAPVQQDEHSQFDRYKNVVGGYGLRERRHQRTCHFVGQVYQVPYYEYEQTKTYGEYFDAERGDNDGLQRIEGITHYLFRNALAQFDNRPPVRTDLVLSKYYAERVKASRRLENIRRDLTAATRPAAISIDEQGYLVVPVRGMSTPLRLMDPVTPVLEQAGYGCVDERVSAGLRHGDLHANNVLVDAERRCCWFIDYENFGLSHFFLVDHLELEASILFAHMNLAGNLELWAALIDAISQPRLGDLSEVELAHVMGEDAAKVTKALAAIRIIRQEVNRINGANPARPYYHALMYEALRTAGKRDAELSRRWHALIAAAILFYKIGTPTP